MFVFLKINVLPFFFLLSMNRYLWYVPFNFGEFGEFIKVKLNCSGRRKFLGEPKPTLFSWLPRGDARLVRAGGRRFAIEFLELLRAPVSGLKDLGERVCAVYASNKLWLREPIPY